MRGRLPLVSIIGAPNAGKSTLFNRLVGYGPGLKAFQPRALVSPMPGTTRDRLFTETQWDGVRFRVCDTGGVYGLDDALSAGLVRATASEPVSDMEPLPMERLVEDQVMAAVEDASVVLYVVDAVEGISPSDERLAPLLRKIERRAGPPHVLLVGNKLDYDLEARRVGFCGELWGLGLGEPRPLSAYHGHGMEALMQDVLELLPPPLTLDGQADEDALRHVAEEAPAAETASRPPDGRAAHAVAAAVAAAASAAEMAIATRAAAAAAAARPASAGAGAAASALD